MSSEHFPEATIASRMRVAKQATTGLRRAHNCVRGRQERLAEGRNAANVSENDTGYLTYLISYSYRQVTHKRAGVRLAVDAGNRLVRLPRVHITVNFTMCSANAHTVSECTKGHISLVNLFFSGYISNPRP
eukprot:5203879-Pleurochrysis_carterae.AAC.1